MIDGLRGRMTRNQRRTVRRVLRNTFCPSCSEAVDEFSHPAALFKGARVIEHFLCSRCFREAASGRAAFQAVAERCVLALSETGGEA